MAQKPTQLIHQENALQEATDILTQHFEEEGLSENQIKSYLCKLVKKRVKVMMHKA